MAAFDRPHLHTIVKTPTKTWTTWAGCHFTQLNLHAVTLFCHDSVVTTPCQSFRHSIPKILYERKKRAPIFHIRNWMSPTLLKKFALPNLLYFLFFSLVTTSRTINLYKTS